MLDRYGRNIEYLRISVTDRCNLRCKYCMPEPLDFVEHDRIMRYEELIRIAKAAVKVGITHFKVTGGEPLVRKGCVEFIRMLKEIPGTETVTLTTNGVLLLQMIPSLKEAGVDGINISLDTMDPVRFAEITGTDALEQVKAAIRASADAGIRTKVNCVLLKQTLEEIEDMITWAESLPVDVRFIELMPIGSGSEMEGVSREEAREVLLERYPDLHSVDEKRGYGPAVYEASELLKGRIGWINAISHKFCGQCNRIRLTSTGILKPCLCYGEGTDLGELVRAGQTEAQLSEAILQAVQEKPKEHLFDEKDRITEKRKMVQIGG